MKKIATLLFPLPLILVQGRREPTPYYTTNQVTATICAGGALNIKKPSKTPSHYLAIKLKFPRKC